MSYVRQFSINSETLTDSETKPGHCQIMSSSEEVSRKQRRESPKYVYECIKPVGNTTYVARRKKLQEGYNKSRWNERLSMYSLRYKQYIVGLGQDVVDGVYQSPNSCD